MSQVLMASLRMRDGVSVSGMEYLGFGAAERKRIDLIRGGRNNRVNDQFI